MGSISWHHPQAECVTDSYKSYSSKQPQNMQPANIYHHCITTHKGHSSFVSSLTLAGNLLYTGSSDGEIRSWKCDDLSTSQEDQHMNDNIVATGKGAVKAMVVLSDKLFTELWSMCSRILRGRRQMKTTDQTKPLRGPPGSLGYLFGVERPFKQTTVVLCP